MFSILAVCHQYLGGSMKNLALLFLISVLVHHSNGQETTKFSVRVTGTFLCHGQPLPAVRVEIYDDAQTMNYPNFYSRFSSKLGTFDITANIATEQYIINPYIVFSHSCWEHDGVEHNCKRKVIIPIPPQDITVGEEPEFAKTFKLGTVELKFPHKNEIRVTCGEV